MKTIIAIVGIYLFGCSSSHISYSCLSRGIDGEYYGNISSWKEKLDREYRVKVFAKNENYLIQMDIGENEPNKEYSRVWQTFVDTLQRINNAKYKCNYLLKGRMSEVYIHRDEVYCEIHDSVSMKKWKLKLVKK